MAVISPTDVATMIGDAKCLSSCIPQGMEMPVLIALTMENLGMSISPATLSSLMSDARCIDSCIPRGMQLSVLISLTAQGGGGGGGGGGSSGVISGNGSPTTHAIGQTLYVQLDSTPPGIVWWWDGAQWN